MLLLSVSSKQVLLIELTVLWEASMEKVKKWNWSKYQELVDESGRRGWKACCEPIEVRY